MIIWIPALFYTDHDERSLPTPAAIDSRPHQVQVETADPAFESLMNDAAWYAEGNVDDSRTIAAAKRLIAAVTKATASPTAGSKPTARTCEKCGKPHGVTFHAMQMPSGRMRSVCAHLRCFEQLRKQAGR